MSENHPIEGLMLTTMSSIRDMIDVNTIIGETIEVTESISIIPISKVSFGFAAGGSEFKSETIDAYSRKDKDEDIQYTLPFGGGTGAGITINPIAFLVIQNGVIKLMPVEHSSYIDRLLDYVPDLMEKISSMMNKNIQNKAEKTDKLINQIKKTSKEIFDREKEFERKEFEDKESNLANKNEISENLDLNAESDGEDL